MPDQNVSVVGLGYIGLPTSILMATKGLRVRGMDINEKVVSDCNAAKLTIVEPGLHLRHTAKYMKQKST